MVGTELLQWGPLAQQRCSERGAMALAFCVTAARRVLAILCGEIVDMNRPPITYGSSYHPVAIYGKSLTGLNMHRKFPV
jgi:hypothetical protein